MNEPPKTTEGGADRVGRENRFADLMRAAQRGERPAYATLLRELTPLLRNVVRARRAGLTAEDVEDVVQDVLLSLHQGRATWDPARPFMPWLMAIARARLADRVRRRVRLGGVEVAVEELPETSWGSATNPESGPPGDAHALRQAIAALPAGQRRALELVKLRELSLEEASSASGASVASLKVAVHRAVRSLRRVLRKEG